MTDKVQKIKEWISKEQEGLMDTQGNFEYPEHEGAYHILCNLDAYIDSLQEEPVNEDLEEAIDTYLKSYWGSEKEKQEWPFLKKMIIYFAKWQKEKMMAKAIDAHCFGFQGAALFSFRLPAGALVDDVWVINYDELAKLPKEEFEKQGEQPNQDNSDVKDYNNIDPHFGKSIDKVEPKFHEGDWVFIEEAKGYKNGLFQIKTVDSFGYSFDEYHTIPFIYEELLSKWTIKDAKDGDVLSYRDGQWIFIYKEKIDDNSFRYHTLYSTIHQDLTINDSGFTLLGDAIIPATKEQRDTLEKAIAEVGYAFDFDKKELKKIEQKPTDEVKPKFKPGDIVKNKKSGVTQILGGCIEDVYEGAFPFRIKDQDEWELVEHNPAEECSLKTNSKLFHQLIPAPKGLGINEIEQEHIKVNK